MHSREVQRQRKREERHRRRHGEARLKHHPRALAQQQLTALRAKRCPLSRESQPNESQPSKSPLRFRCWTSHRHPRRNLRNRSGNRARTLLRCALRNARRPGQNLRQQPGRRLRRLALQHAQPRRSALRLGQFTGALHAACNVPVERALLSLAQHSIHRLGQHRLADGAGHRPLLKAFGFAKLAEFAHVCHSHHLPFYTLQKPCQFTSPTADPALHRTLWDS